MAIKAGRVGVNPADVDKQGHVTGGQSYELPPATSSKLGGVKVSDGLSVEEDGSLSVSVPVAAVSLADAGKVLAVKSDGSGTEWIEPSTGGGVVYVHNVKTETPTPEGYLITTGVGYYVPTQAGDKIITRSASPETKGKYYIFDNEKFKDFESLIFIGQSSAGTIRDSQIGFLNEEFSEGLILQDTVIGPDNKQAIEVPVKPSYKYLIVIIRGDYSGEMAFTGILAY